MLEIKGVRNRKEYKEAKNDMRRIALIGQRFDYSNRNKVLVFCAELLKRPQIFQSIVGRRYIKELRKSALNLDEKYQCVACLKEIDKNFYFCEKCYQEILFDQMTIKKEKPSSKSSAISKNKRGGWLIAGFCLCFICGIISVKLLPDFFKEDNPIPIEGKEEMIPPEKANTDVRTIELANEESYLQKKSLLEKYKAEQLDVYNQMTEELLRLGNTYEGAAKTAGDQMQNQYPICIYRMDLDALNKKEIEELYNRFTEIKSYTIPEENELG